MKLHSVKVKSDKPEESLNTSVFKFKINSKSKTENTIEIVTRVKNIAEQKVEKNIVRLFSIVETMSVIITDLSGFASFWGHKCILCESGKTHRSVSHDLEELHCNTMQR